MISVPGGDFQGHPAAKDRHQACYGKGRYFCAYKSFKLCVSVQEVFKKGRGNAWRFAPEPVASRNIGA